jgi:hypothetical protein
MKTTCERCFSDINTGQHGVYLCPLEPRRASAVIGDDIPGGVLIEHGLVNADGSPRRYYSKSEMAAEAKRRGLLNLVEHKGTRGSDRSPHTTRWV